MMSARDIAVRDGDDNRAAVWNFFRDNPCHNRTECAAALGLHRKTVESHAAAIKDGWRPKDGPELCAVCGAQHHHTCTSWRAQNG